MNAALTLTPRCLAALRLLEDADLDVLPAGRAWTIVDNGNLDGVEIARGATLAAAVDAALPVALRDGYVMPADLAALDADDGPLACRVCRGCGEGAHERAVCSHCRGTGTEPTRGDA